MHKYSMTASEMESDKKCKLSGWSASALVLWCVAAGCGLIWVVTYSDSQGELWLAVIQLGAIFGTAFGALFLAVGLASNNIHDKKPRVLLLLGISVSFICIIFPAWTLMLPNDGPPVYIYWKLGGTGLAVLTGSVFIMFIIQKYIGKHKSINKFFQLVDKFDRISFRKKCMCAVIIGLIGAFVWEASRGTLTNPYIIIDFISAVIHVIGLLSVISQFFKLILSQINDGSKAENSTDEPITHEQLLKKLNIITADLKYVRNAVEHMK